MSPWQRQKHPRVLAQLCSTLWADKNCNMPCQTAASFVLLPQQSSLAREPNLKQEGFNRTSSQRVLSRSQNAGEQLAVTMVAEKSELTLK
jgi:hypothetical protein